MERIAYFLDVDINQVVYLRRNNKVVAAKYRGFVCKRGDCTTHKFDMADGTHETISVSSGYTTGKHYSVYPTIEDAIHDTNILSFQWQDITPTLIEKFGFNHEFTCVGRKELGLAKWKWDAYHPERIHVWHECFDIIFDGDWSCKLTFRGADKYYDTANECREKNHVDVVTF